MRRPIHFILALFITVLIAISAQATTTTTTTIKISDENLVSSVRAIVTGKVLSIESRWDSERGSIYTYITVSLTEVIKGEIQSDKIVIEQIGGQYGKQKAWLVGSPEFRLNEDVLLFLNTDDRGVLHTAHLEFGKFSMVKGESAAPRALLRMGEQFQATNYIEHVKGLVQSISNIAAQDVAIQYQPVLAGNSEPQKEFTLLTSRFFQPDTNGKVNFSVNANAPVSGGGVNEVNSAISAWNGSGSKLTLVNAGATTNCGAVMDGTSTISFGDCMKQIDDPVNGQGIIATSMLFLGNDFRIINGLKYTQINEADIVFNNGFNNTLSVSSNLAELVTHYLGNAFGLDNSSNDPNEPSAVLRQAVMYFQPHFDGRGAKINTDDIAGVLALYPFFTPIQFVNPALPNPILLAPYGQQLVASSGFPPYTFTLAKGSLPVGLTLSPTGLISGTAQVIETQTFDVLVTDQANFRATQTFTIAVTALMPRLDTVTPQRVRYNGDSIITLTGINFLSVTAITLSNGSVANFRVIDDNTLAAAIIGPGTTGVIADITVVNPGGTSKLNSALLFDGPVLNSAMVSRVRTRNSKGKPLNKRGIIVRGTSLTFNQQIKINGTAVPLVVAKDLITNELCYFGKLKGLLPKKGKFSVSIFDPDLNSESNTVKADAP